MIKVYGSWCVYCKLGWLTEFHATLRSSSNFSFFILLLLLRSSQFYERITKDLRLFFFFLFKIHFTNQLSFSMLENLSIEPKISKIYLSL